MKKITIPLVLILFILILSACTNQSKINSEKNLLNEISNVTQEEELNPITIYNSESWKSLIPESCQSFFDGCNNCRRMETGSEAACTRMYCETYEEPSCLDGDNNSDLTVTYNSESWKSLIPESCQSFFDGCNNCRRMEEGSEAACTMMYCETYEKPNCLD